MHEVLHALMPFLIGIDSRYKQQILDSIDSEDKVIFDVDHNKFIRHQSHIRLPSTIKQYMQGVGQKGEWSVLQLKRVYSNVMLGLINNILPFRGHHFDYQSYMDMFPNDSLFYQHFSIHSMMFNQFVNNGQEEGYLLHLRLFLGERDLRPLVLESHEPGYQLVRRE